MPVLPKCWIHVYMLWIGSCFRSSSWQSIEEFGLRVVYCTTVPAVSKEEIGLYVTAAEDIVQRGCSVTSLCSALWILEGWGFITLSSPEVDGEPWCAPKGFHYVLLGNILFWRIWKQSKNTSCFPGEKEKAEKVVGWGNVHERWPLSATFTSWLMLGVGATYTNRTSCMGLHFADFNHSRVCLLQVVISFWSVNWDRSLLLRSMQWRSKNIPLQEQNLLLNQ